MNPLQDNPLVTRDDFARSVVQLWNPLKPFFSPGCARVSLSRTGAHFTTAAAELEGFARPLFGIAPLSAGGFDFADWDMLTEGFANGMDPGSDEYWGDIYDYDQRLVESAAIGFALLFAKDRFWDPLDDARKQNVARWLKMSLTKSVVDNNWLFFHVFASLALEKCGVDHDVSVRVRALDALEEFYVGDGWYSDGISRRFDHYIPFAMHYYGLIYAAVADFDADRGERFRARARLFAKEFRNWFDAEGGSVAFGRSMTYRFAQASFWGALAHAGEPALPWGEIRGLWARHLRWWGRRDYFDRDGVMPVGYLYPNLLMSERYNSPGSPYWCMKAYLPLALPESHPFWQAEEEPLATENSVVSSPVPGTLSFDSGNNRVLLVSCSEMRMPQRGAAEKYGKFAYSSAFGFSIDHDREGFLSSPFDNMLAFSADCRAFSVRADIDDALIGDDWIHSQWSPEDGIIVETWLIARPPWHVRCHRIVSEVPRYTVEGGFAIERTDSNPLVETGDAGMARIETANAATLAVDLSTEPRTARAQRTLPNSSLYFPRTHVPHLCCRIDPGETWLVGAFVASTNPGDAASWVQDLPVRPDLSWLQSLKLRGKPVVGMKRREAPPEDRWPQAFRNVAPSPAPASKR